MHHLASKTGELVTPGIYYLKQIRELTIRSAVCGNNVYGIDKESKDYAHTTMKPAPTAGM